MQRYGYSVPARSIHTVTMKLVGRSYTVGMPMLYLNYTREVEEATSNDKVS
jgi:hypothetical protein